MDLSVNDSIRVFTIFFLVNCYNPQANLKIKHQHQHQHQQKQQQHHQTSSSQQLLILNP